MTSAALRIAQALCPRHVAYSCLCRPGAQREAAASVDAAEVAERIRGFVEAMSGLEGAEVRRMLRPTCKCVSVHACACVCLCTCLHADWAERPHGGLHAYLSVLSRSQMHARTCAAARARAHTHIRIYAHECVSACHTDTCQVHIVSADTWHARLALRALTFERDCACAPVGCINRLVLVEFYAIKIGKAGGEHPVKHKLKSIHWPGSLGKC